MRQGLHEQEMASTLRSSSGRTLTWRHDQVIFLGENGGKKVQKSGHGYKQIYINIGKINNNPMNMVSLSREQCGWGAARGRVL